MAISGSTARGSGTFGNNNAGSTVTQTPGATVTVGKILLTFVTTRQNVAVASITDAVGNSWQFLARYSNGTNGNAHVEVWLCVVENQLASNTTITATFDGSVNDACIATREYTVGAGMTLKQTAEASVVGNEVNGANGFGSTSFSSLTSKQRLYVRCLAKRANTTTGITATANFTNWALTIRSRNSANDAIVARAEERINTSTGETSNPTLNVSGNTAGLFLALEEVAIATAPSVTTNPVDQIKAASARGRGNVTADGGATVTERGVVWNTTGTPTTADDKAQAAAGGTGVFSATMTGLQGDTLYFVRAYAINSVGTSYGEETTFKFEPFPQRAVVLDDFNRADENPLSQSGNWATWGSNPLRVVSNEVASTNGQWSGAYRADKLFGPDCEVFVQVSESKPAAFDLEFYLRADLETNIYYFATIDESSFLVLKSDGVNVDEVITTPSPLFVAPNGTQAGDYLGVSIIGNRLRFYVKHSGEEWMFLGYAEDNDIASAGRVILAIHGNISDLRLDNFGAGDFTVQGGSEASVEVAAEGAGMKLGASSSEAQVIVASEGGGEVVQPVVEGGSESAVLIAAEGSATKLASGAAEAPVEVAAQGAGEKTLATGGSEAFVQVASEGEGTKQTSGAAESAVEISPEGQGQKLASGAAESEVEITPAGAGQKLASSESEAPVIINPEGAGQVVDGIEGGSEARVTVSPEGAGTKLVSGASESAVQVSAEGAGERVDDTVQGGSEASITVGAEGEGQKLSLGASEAVLQILAEAFGAKAAAGSGEAVVMITASGGGALPSEHVPALIINRNSTSISGARSTTTAGFVNFRSTLYQ